MLILYQAPPDDEGDVVTSQVPFVIFVLENITQEIQSQLVIIQEASRQDSDEGRRTLMVSLWDRNTKDLGSGRGQLWED